MGFGDKLREAVEKIRRLGVLDGNSIREITKEIQRALLGADVQVALVLRVSKKIEDEAFKELPPGLNRREHIAKLTYDALVDLIGGSGKKDIPSPRRLMLVGLFGSGKTTTAGKLAKYYSKRGLKVATIAADTFRPAAVEQLRQVSERAGVPCFFSEGEKHAATAVKNALQKAGGSFDLLICDSAGRSALDDELSREIREIREEFQPDESWLVLGADIGQLAEKQARAFDAAVSITGVVLTRTDGSAKGGGALAACHTTSSPVYFIGTGEKMEDLEIFDANRFLSRVMGYGDLQGLLEKVSELNIEKEISAEEIFEGGFNLQMFYDQLKAARSMGPIGKVAELMGLKTQLPKEFLDTGEKKLDNFRVIMDSMTKQEKTEPDKINHARITRIAAGAGKTENDVRELLKQYKQMKKMFKDIKKIGSMDMEKMKSEAVMQKMMQKMQAKKMRKKGFKIR